MAAEGSGQPVEPLTPTLIVSDQPIEGVWTQLSLWESQSLAAKLIRERATQAGIALDPEVLQRKSAALAYCLKNAKEYLRSGQTAITQRVVANYYGCLWLASAILVADPANAYDLEKLEKATKSGHGLGNIADERATFPGNEFVYIRESGFFPEFLKSQGVTRAQLNSLKIPGAPLQAIAGLAPEIASRLIPLDDILARIPELKGIFEYITDQPGLSFGVAHAFYNHEVQAGDTPDPASIFGGRVKRAFTWLSLSNSETMTREFVEANGPPLAEWELRTFAGDTSWEGKVMHPPGELHWDYIKTYKSAMCGTCWVKPINNHLSDMLAVNLMLLYEFSILARYRPAVWREIIEGQFDQYRALIEAYNQVVDRVIPELALKTISARHVLATTSGSLFGPV